MEKLSLIKCTVVALIILLTGGSHTGWASPLSSSQNYRIEAQVISGIGGASSSSIYRLTVSGAQSAVMDIGRSSNSTGSNVLNNGFLNTVDWQRFVAYSYPSRNANSATGSTVFLGLNMPVNSDTIGASNVVYYSSIRGFVSNAYSYAEAGRDVSITLALPDEIGAGERARVSVLSTIKDLYGNSFRPHVVDFMGKSGTQGGAHTSQILGGDSGTKYVRGLAVADFDRDGYPDVAMIDTPSAKRIQIWINDSQGSFSSVGGYNFSPATSLSVGDLNRDGSPDLLITRDTAGSSLMLMGNGSGGFTTNLQNFGIARSATLADVDGNGFLDVIVGRHGAEDVRIFFNGELGIDSTPFTIQTPTRTPNSLATADLNLDGSVDVVVGFASGLPNILLNQGSGMNYLPGEISGESGNYEELVVADINQDGWPDIIGAANPGGVRSWTNNRTGGFVASYNDGVTANGVALADMTGNGLPDLVIARAANAVVIATNTGNGQFVDWRTNISPNAAMSIGLADFNADQYVDMVAAINSVENNSRVWIHTTPPEAPLVLSATGITATAFWISWTEVTNALQYRVEVAKNSAELFTPVAYTSVVVAAPFLTMQFTDSDGNINTPYFFRVRAENLSGNSDYVMTQAVTTCAGCILTNSMGIPLSWIDQYYPGGQGDYDAVLLTDTDSDGWVSWEEYIVGTDPTNAMSIFGYSISNNMSAAELMVRISNSLGGRIYGMQATTNLLQLPSAWTGYSQEKSGTGGLLNFILTNDVPGRAYRINIRLGE